MFLASSGLYAQPGGVTVPDWHDTLPEAVKIDSRKIAREIGKLSTDIRNIRTVVTPLGEGDPIKWAQTLPGVATGADGTVAMYVRGGNMSNNLISIDGVPIYGYSHILGLTTVVPQSVLSSVSLLKGGFEGADGNFTAAHLKMRTKTPVQGFRAEASLNTFLAGAQAEGRWKKLSAIVSARVSPLSLEYQAVKGALPSFLGGIEDFDAGVWDTYGKIRYDFNDRIYLEMSGMKTRDNYLVSLGEDSFERFGWENTLGSMRFHASGKKSENEVLLYYSDYGNFQQQDKMFRGVMNHFSLSSGIREKTLSAHRDRVFGRKRWFGLSYGGSWRNMDFSSGHYDAEDVVLPTEILSGFVQSNVDIPDILKMRVFARRNRYEVRNRHLKVYNNMHTEYGAWLSVNAGRHVSIELTYDELVQYYHSLEGMPTGWSLDILVPSNFSIVPERTKNASAGFSLHFDNHSFSAAAFGKRQENIPFFKYSAALFSGALNLWERYVEWGRGQAYGGEFLYEFQGKDIYARAAYTISKTTRSGFAGVNDGGEFHARFDRTHILNAIFQWKGLSAALTMQSGNWENGASEKYEVGLFPSGSFTGDYYSGYNHYRMPTVFRIDLGYNHIFTTGRLSHDVSVGVCNVTNHFNPFVLYYDTEIEQYKGLSLLPIMPNFSYRLIF